MFSTERPKERDDLQKSLARCGGERSEFDTEEVLDIPEEHEQEPAAEEFEHAFGEDVPGVYRAGGPGGHRELLRDIEIVVLGVVHEDARSRSEEAIGRHRQTEWKSLLRSRSSVSGSPAARETQASTRSATERSVSRRSTGAARFAQEAV